MSDQAKRHALSEEVEKSAGPWFWDSRGLRNDERHPRWYAHIRKCEECARNYLTVPAEEARYCPAGLRVKDRDLEPLESERLGWKVRAKRLRNEERARRREEAGA